MAQPKKTVQQVLDQLRSTPQRLRELTSGVPPELLRTSPAPDEWSANDVLAHLRACSDKWGEAATRIVEEEHPCGTAIGSARGLWSVPGSRLS
jgi:hypothetical protein